MEYSKTYRKIAESAIVLGHGISADECVPIGLDGYVAASLVDYAQYLYAIPRNPFLARILQASSKTGDIDREKLHEILISPRTGSALCFLDMRTKSGALGNILRKEINEWNEEHPYIEAYYAVLFDPDKKADICGSEKELSDLERPKWLPSEEHVKSLIGKDSYGKFFYNIYPESKNSFNHIHDIELEILKIFNEDMEVEMKKLDEMI